jgi:hypothetical protein
MIRRRPGTLNPEAHGSMCRPDVADVDHSLQSADDQHRDARQVHDLVRDAADEQPLSIGHASAAHHDEPGVLRHRHVHDLLRGPTRKGGPGLRPRAHP